MHLFPTPFQVWFIRAVRLPPCVTATGACSPTPLPKKLRRTQSTDGIPPAAPYTILTPIKPLMHGFGLGRSSPELENIFSVNNVINKKRCEPKSAAFLSVFYRTNFISIYKVYSYPPIYALPPIYIRRGSGIKILPSSCKLFSRKAINIRGGATTVLLRVCGK